MLYERYDGAGKKVERAFTVDGSDRDAELAAKADDGLEGWERADTAAADGGEMPVPPTGRPADSALKTAWVAWAVACGADPERAQAATKGELIDTYGHLTPVPKED